MIKQSSINNSKRNKKCNKNYKPINIVVNNRMHKSIHQLYTNMGSLKDRFH